jgi:hypothetical protein
MVIATVKKTGLGLYISGGALVSCIKPWVLTPALQKKRKRRMNE